MKCGVDNTGTSVHVMRGEAYGPCLCGGIYAEGKERIVVPVLSEVTLREDEDACAPPQVVTFRRGLTRSGHVAYRAERS